MVVVTSVFCSGLWMVTVYCVTLLASRGVPEIVAVSSTAKPRGKSGCVETEQCSHTGCCNENDTGWFTFNSVWWTA